MEKQRKRAPSARSLQTKERILDAAEQVFAERGFEGASIRDIAALAGVQVGLVHHHGGGKEELFHQTVARRASELSDLRLSALEAARARHDLTLRDVLDCFVRPYIDLAQGEEPHWVAYGRLVAQVSADERWRPIAAECFDPTAQRFLAEMARLYPGADPQLLAGGLVYSVSAMLAQVTSGWRIGALSTQNADQHTEALITFCTAGVEAMIDAG